MLKGLVDEDQEERRKTTTITTTINQDENIITKKEWFYDAFSDHSFETHLLWVYICVCNVFAIKSYILTLIVIIV